MERSPAAGCPAFREALSARLDGEDEPIDAALTDAHLRRCSGCRAWHAEAATATRLLRVQQVPVQPSGVDNLLAALDAHGVLPAGVVHPAPSDVTLPDPVADDAPQVVAAPPGRGHQPARRLPTWPGPVRRPVAEPGSLGRLIARPGAVGRRRVVVALRVLLGGFGAAQFVLGIAQVTNAATATDLHGDGAGHLWHESAAWNVAIGAGFGWIASRRGRPAGALPMLTAFVALLALLSANDVLAGRVETERLLSHGFVLAGYAIVLALTRPALDPGRPPSRLPADDPHTPRSPQSPGGDGSTGGDNGGTTGGGTPPRRPPLRLVPGQATARTTDREAA